MKRSQRDAGCRRQPRRRPPRRQGPRPAGQHRGRRCRRPAPSSSVSTARRARRRNAAPHGSREHVAAIDLIGRIEVEIARIERAMDPPLGLTASPDGARIPATVASGSTRSDRATASRTRRSPIPTDVKLRFIELLVDAGLREIEATSFVSPRAIPQLADADELMARLPAPTWRPLPGPRPERARSRPRRGRRRRRDRRLHRGDRRLHASATSA